MPPSYAAQLEALAQHNPNYHRIYAQGLWGKLEHLIYHNWQVVPEIKQPAKEYIYGLDFGYNNPSAFIEIAIRDGVPYIKELLYESGLTNEDLINRCEKLIRDKKHPVYADSSEPARIEAFRRRGFNIYPADKSVIDGIDYVKSLKAWYIIDGSENVLKEVRSYSYKLDKDGNVLEEPLKHNDHGMDATRYSLYTYAKSFKITQADFRRTAPM